MTNHFNRLTEAETERLAILAEECSEVIQVIGKILRHGYESRNPTISNSETNRKLLERELGDLIHAQQRVEASGDVNTLSITEQAASKAERIRNYLHHQA